MKWSWKLCEIRGIGVYMHATFLILIGFVILSHYSAGHSVAKTLEGVGFILAIFACVVLHEFGHALMAARYGIKTKDITLLPIGGIARLERMPEKPIEELWVALAGPAVNVVIAAGLFAWLQLAGAFAPLEQLSLTSGPFLERCKRTPGPFRLSPFGIELAFYGTSRSLSSLAFRGESAAASRIKLLAVSFVTPLFHTILPD